ncbi:MAG: hypothetical protein WCK27_06365 [Verrucomicrobiota bacterium]|nr:hypothetical protein [Verrucomicrobiota bacterium]
MIRHALFTRCQVTLTFVPAGSADTSHNTDAELVGLVRHRDSC